MKAAISGNYADLKYIKTRSVVQLVVEVPIERANEITDAFGWPQPGKEIPVAVARLNVVPAELKSKQKFEDLPPSQQAGIRCNDPAFQRWCEAKVLNLKESWPISQDEQAEATATFVRRHCGVLSRRDLDLCGAEAEYWADLNAEFEADTRLPERR